MAPIASPVVLLHGLARSASSMDKLASRLTDAGYPVCNIDYPSRHHPIEVLTTEHVLPAIDACLKGKPSAPHVHFVTHSMGGILVRQMATMALRFKIGRVVMLSPPNQGSEVVDVLGGTWFFDWINGPAGNQLGTGARSVPNQLGPAPFELGVMTGDRSINLILSTMIDGEDDGKVSIQSARLEGMQDFLVMPASHPFIMKDPAVIAQALTFLRHGRFMRETQRPSSP